MAAGAAHQIEVSIWSRSLLANVLDNTPAGQWVRWKLLGVTQELLSSELLAELSKTSMDTFRPSMDDPRAWVPRQLDQVLRSTRLPINFVVSESRTWQNRWLLSHCSRARRSRRIRANPAPRVGSANEHA